MVAQPKENPKPKPKPPIVSSFARGHLNPVESAKDSQSTIKAWCLEQGHTRGYGIATKHWKHIFCALRLAMNSGKYPEPQELRDALQELLRPFDYDEDAWRERGELVLRGDDPRKDGVYIGIRPYISPESVVYSPVGENMTDDLILTGKEEEETRDH